MKKILFLVFLGGLFFFVATRSMADCPPNWQSSSFTMYDPINGCWYFVAYCYKCGVTGPDPGNIKITYYRKLSGNCTEVNIDLILRTIAQRFFNDCSIPECYQNDPLKVIVEYPLCQNYRNRVWTDQNGVRQQFLEVESCYSSYYCQRIR